MKKIYIYLLLLSASIIFTEKGFSSEDRENIFSSVTVLPNFTMTLDNNFLDFGLVEPGKKIILKDSTYYNSAICTSNKGTRWVLKLFVKTDIMGPDGSIVPPSYFKWKIYTTDGQGSYSEQWNDFSQTPQIAYTASGDDLTGKDVTIRFQYSLELPPQAKAGHYAIRVGYSLTEE